MSFASIAGVPGQHSWIQGLTLPCISYQLGDLGKLLNLCVSLLYIKADILPILWYLVITQLQKGYLVYHNLRHYQIKLDCQIRAFRIASINNIINKIIIAFTECLLVADAELCFIYSSQQPFVLNTVYAHFTDEGTGTLSNWYVQSYTARKAELNQIQVWCYNISSQLF